MNSYITIEEALLFFPNASEYESDNQQLALTTSYSLVNSYLNNTIPIPALTSEGKIPGLLKLQQGKFFQYILEFSNQGQTEELQQLFDKTAEFLSKLTKNELLISEVQTTSQDIGWNLSEVTLTVGEVFVKGIPPENKSTYSFTVSVPGYTASAQFNIYRSDSPDIFKQITGSYDWQNITGTNLYIRFDGQFLLNESFSVTGIPETKILTSTTPRLQQSEIIY